MLAVASSVVGLCNIGSAFINSYWGFFILRIVIGAFSVSCRNTSMTLRKCCFQRLIGFDQVYTLARQCVLHEVTNDLA